MRPIDAAWLAGLLEGEGCFDVYESSSGYPVARIRLQMCDKDIVERAHQLIGGNGSVREIVSDNPNHKDTYRAGTASRDVVKDVLLEILPYMGERRTESINDMLNVIDNHEPKSNESTYFENGEDHPSSKLRKKEVREIRRLYDTGKITQSLLGQMFGVGQRQISYIINGENWAHI